MAGKKILSCMKKRDLLNSGKTDAAELIRLGESYLQEDRLSDAIDFFEKARHFEGLTQLKERCATEGDYFLYHRVAMILGDSPSSEEWIQLGNSALDQGKLLFARLAYQQADHRNGVAQVEKLLGLPTHERSSNKNMLH